MKPLQLTITAIFMTIATVATAQKARLTDGDLAFLKGVKKLNIQYDYSNMEVGKKTEKEYVEDKRKSFNEKEAGRGDKWAKSWVADRENRFEPRMQEEFNKNCDIQLGKYPNEKYTMIFKTTFTEPGFNIGITRKNAYVDGEVWIVETANPSKVLAKIEIPDCPGRTFMGMDYDTGERIQEAYAMAGKGLAKFFRKNVD